MRLRNSFISLLLLITLVITGDVLAQAADPVTLVAEKKVHDFGSIAQGRPVYFAFKLENKSAIPVVIDNVQASCGCTTPEWTSQPVGPGTDTFIKVGFNAAAEGPFEKTIQVFYQQGRQLELVIRGNVWKTPDHPAPLNKHIISLKNVRFK